MPPQKYTEQHSLQLRGDDDWIMVGFVIKAKRNWSLSVAEAMISGWDILDLRGVQQPCGSLLRVERSILTDSNKPS